MFNKNQHESGGSISQFSKDHTVSRSTFRDWKRAYDTWMETGVLKLYEDRGRPTLLNGVGLDKLK